MNKEKKQLEKILEEAINKYNDIIENYNKRKYNAYTDYNDGLSPNIDICGRLHAPCDGYVFSNNGGIEEVYNKGEFLPEPESLEDFFFGQKDQRINKKSKKILILESQKKNFKDLAEKAGEQFTVSFSSSSWYVQKFDDSCTYVYIGGNAATLFYNDFIEQQNKMLNNIKNSVDESMPVMEDQREADIKGIIVGIRLVEDNYASTYNNIVFKKECLIKLDQGNVISGTLSKKMLEAIPENEESVDFLVGKKIEMKAEIRVQQSNNKKGYYKSPKQIVIKDENDQILGKKKEVKRKLKIS